MSCSEVMYQAYYPYLYQRPGAAPPVSAHPVPRAGPFSSPFASAAHQYDRFNVQRLQDSHINQPSTSSVSLPGEHSHSHSLYLHGTGTATAAAASGVASAAAGTTGTLGPHSSAGSVSSTGGISPTSPHRSKEEECSLHGRSSTEVTHHGIDEDDSEEETASSRAQYVSANCVVFTHYQGDASSVVDEHFSRALDKTTQSKDTSPMSQRNFPASFWNSHYQPAINAVGPGGPGGSGSHHTDLYSDHYHPSDPWYHQYSTHHRAVHEYHHHNMAQYSGLLLPGSRLHVGAHGQCKAVDWQHAPLDPPYSSYPGMSGLEAQVQESSKDLYWF
ncbi:vestigial [Carabus blaptoides fortunei]